MGWELAMVLTLGIFMASAAVCWLAYLGVSRRQEHGYEAAVQAETEQRLKRLALIDPVTGCANHAAYQAHMDELTGTAVPVALVVLDIDGFTEVNDVYGRDAGDRVLTLLANRLGIRIAADERVFRLGGDEFVIVQSGPDGSGEADLLARCRALVQEPVTMREGSLGLRASMGSASGIAGAKLNGMLREADQAMWRAKAEPTRPTNPILFPLPSQRDPSDSFAFRRRANPALYS